MTRPHAEQTSLERTLWAHLWQPEDRLKRCLVNLPSHVKRKEYAAAADCQKAIMESEYEIKMWENLLNLYEEERSASLNCAEKILANQNLPSAHPANGPLQPTALQTTPAVIGKKPAGLGSGGD